MATKAQGPRRVFGLTLRTVIPSLLTVFTLVVCATGVSDRPPTAEIQIASPRQVASPLGKGRLP